MTRAGFLVAVMLVSCTPDFVNGDLKCSVPDRRCPDGFYCADDDTCWELGSAPDLSMGSDDLNADDMSSDDGIDAMSTVCDPVAQTGCPSGQRCTWIRDQASAAAQTGHIGCAPDGNVGLDGACTWGPSGTTGYDDCKAGLVCDAPTNTDSAAGNCTNICVADAQGTTPGACYSGWGCTFFAGYFDKPAEAPTLGLCEHTCDPVTQKRDGDFAPNCGGTAGNPLGCYGAPDVGLLGQTQFVCVRVLHPNFKSDALAYDPAVGGVVFNSCAPGYEPLLLQNQAASGDKTKTICVALCKPGDTSSSATANAGGLVGSGHTCADSGAGGTHECRYWWFLEQNSSRYSDTVGFCIDYTLYTYDATPFGGTANTVDPSCTTLSPSGHKFDPMISDAKIWGCLNSVAP